MSYDVDFYKAYEAYLREPSVREAHDWVFSLIKDNPNFQNVVDLGCGMSREFYRHFHPRYYRGIDENVEDIEPSFAYTLSKRNYRKTTQWDMATSFVSLFSCEITAPCLVNYEYYNKIFLDSCRMGSGLVSGFFYASKKYYNPVIETGEVRSYQTLEGIDTVVSSVFSEKRIVLPVPSAMFGKDVFEVWKLFERK